MSPSTVELPPRTPAHPDRGPSGLGRRAVILATIVLSVIAVSTAIFAAAYVAGGDDAISDNWVGYLAGTAWLGGLGVSLVAFVMAIVAKVRHTGQVRLWFPLALFPTLTTAMVLIEWLWME